MLFEIWICITTYAKLDANRLNGILVSKHVESLDFILKKNFIEYKNKKFKVFLVTHGH